MRISRCTACCTCEATGTSARQTPPGWRPQRGVFSRGSDSGTPTGSSPPSMDDGASHKPSLLERLGALVMREPEDRDQLIQLLRSAYDRNLLDADALPMVAGAIQVSEMKVRGGMIPRAQLAVIDLHEP